MEPREGLRLLGKVQADLSSSFWSGVSVSLAPWFGLSITLLDCISQALRTGQYLGLLCSGKTMSGE